METFVDDEAGYRRWLADHPTGSVLNVPRSGTNPLLVLHTAGCTFISSPTRTNYTTTAYYKVCATDATDLVAWAATQPGSWKHCGVCSPDPNAANQTRASRAPTRAASAVIAKSADVAWEPANAGGAMGDWHLWTHGAPLGQITHLEPRLASWDSKTAPSQIALHAYLDPIAATLAPILQDRTGLFLHLAVDVQNPTHLLRHHDLENYLTPIVQRLGATHFTFVSATKRVGGGSQLTVGYAAPLVDPAALVGWDHLTAQPAGRPTDSAWKTDLRVALIGQHPAILPPGPVDVQIAWRGDPATANKRWVEWWKPTGDAMGPVLGEPTGGNPFNPSDDRIVSLGLHLQPDPAGASGVAVGLWWRPHQLQAL
ncbi:MAG: hypothetical protein M3Z04_04545 [Chloroflexota bacterium]|nr:hypothetical protein [Chloroflexota bacterium]